MRAQMLFLFLLAALAPLSACTLDEPDFGGIGEEPGDSGSPPPEDCANDIDDDEDELLDCDDPDCDGDDVCS